MHMAQLMPVLLAVSCFSKIQIGFTFLVAAYPGSPGQRAIKHVCYHRGEQPCVSCSSWAADWFTFLVPAHSGSPGKRAVKWVCVCSPLREKRDVMNKTKYIQCQDCVMSTVNVLKNHTKLRSLRSAW